MTKNLVVVESPAKAKTINKYLGGDFKVVASMGHIRDLSPTDGSVKPSEDFAMVWEVSPRAKKNLQLIAENCKNIQKLYLATDPDREGEAISWHITEELKKSGLFQKIPVVHRIVFHEITKNAVNHAIQHPRDIDLNLVNAYLARRALDYLVGFTLSPVLWRKLPGSKSAGRVQSAALRIICERELEINKFKKTEYWSIPVLLQGKNAPFNGKLTHINGQKLDAHAIENEQMAVKYADKIDQSQFSVHNIERKQSKRNPFAPYTTSTLQQDASRKLGFSAQKTMQVAQKLYEGVEIQGESIGLITYMRTDSISVGMDAIKTARTMIEQVFGDKYLPNAPRMYKTKSKNAQEAHEAIRPTDINLRPDSISDSLNNDELKLYRLIWNRMVASQMSSADIDTTTIYIADKNNEIGLTASGHIIKFDGFLTLYQVDSDDDEEGSKKLPPLSENEAIQVQKYETKQHFTEPPPRYNEASLIKKLEEAGIGRPSTYATIIKVLQEREYVALEARKFVPDGRGMILSQFLSEYYDKFFNTIFTAQMEDQLDDVSNGDMAWKTLLGKFWEEFNAIISDSSKLQNKEIRERLDKTLGEILIKNRQCPKCDGGNLALNFGKFGAYIACSNYPNCNYKQNIGSMKNAETEDGEPINPADDYPRVLGNDTNGLEVSLRKGPFGIYVQRAAPTKTEKPKNAAIPKNTKPEAVTLQLALQLLALPRVVGQNPNDGLDILTDFGKFGAYLKYNGQYYNIKEDSPLEIGLNRAMEIISSGGDKKPKTPETDIGEHPKGGKIVQKSGRYGPYIQWGRALASLPKGKTTLSVSEAVELLEKKAKK